MQCFVNGSKIVSSLVTVQWQWTVSPLPSRMYGQNHPMREINDWQRTNHWPSFWYLIHLWQKCIATFPVVSWKVIVQCAVGLLRLTPLRPDSTARMVLCRAGLKNHSKACDWSVASNPFVWLVDIECWSPMVVWPLASPLVLLCQCQSTLKLRC